MSTTDPSRNIVLFARGSNPDDALAAEVRAQDDDGIQRAWRQVTAQHGVRADQVTELFAEWQPSTADAEYIAETFGDVGVSYMFPRPEPHGWDAALAEAGAAIEAEAERRANEEMDQALSGIMESTQDAAVLPVLRSASLPDSDFIRQTMPWRYVVGDKIYVTLARMAMTPRGTVGMTHVMRHQVADEDEFTAQLADAIMAVTDGLLVEGLLTDDGEMMQLRRKDGFNAAAAILLPDFHKWVSGIRDWPELIVAITCPDMMYVAPAGSACAEKLREAVRHAEQEAPEFLPTLLRITADGTELLLEGGHQAGQSSGAGRSG